MISQSVSSKAISEIAADNILLFFLNYFSEKIRLGISCHIVIDDLHEKSSLIFSKRIQKNKNVVCCSCDKHAKG